MGQNENENGFSEQSEQILTEHFYKYEMQNPRCEEKNLDHYLTEMLRHAQCFVESDEMPDITTVDEYVQYHYPSQRYSEPTELDLYGEHGAPEGEGEGELTPWIQDMFRELSTEDEDPYDKLIP